MSKCQASCSVFVFEVRFEIRMVRVRQARAKACYELSFSPQGAACDECKRVWDSMYHSLQRVNRLWIYKAIRQHDMGRSMPAVP